MPAALQVVNDSTGDGIFGEAADPKGAGVRGRSVPGGNGVDGSAFFGTGGIGVYAASIFGTGGTGLFATSIGPGNIPDGYGVQGYGVIGVFGSGSSNGVFGQAGDIGVAGTGFAGVQGYSPLSQGAGVTAWGPKGFGLVAAGGKAGAFIKGDLWVHGSILVWPGQPKSAVVKLRDGSRRALYCVESPECWFEDFGRARLVRGRARVRLDRTFAAVIRTGDYHVFLSPEGLSHGLYVSHRTREGFEVREQHRGTNTVRFSYRIVARRKDVAAPRFKRVTLPALPKLTVPKPPAPSKRPPLPKLPEGPDLAKLRARARGADASRRSGAGKKPHK